MVLLHGGGVCYRGAIPTAEVLAREFYVIVVAYDGFNPSEPDTEFSTVMDEATASLDVDNETVIQESLSKLIREKTVLIIAHRMRTIANADKVVVLKDGVVAEQGTPEELGKKMEYTSICQRCS